MIPTSTIFIKQNDSDGIVEISIYDSSLLPLQTNQQHILRKWVFGKL
jgi:hypothetical protein